MTVAVSNFDAAVASDVAAITNALATIASSIANIKAARVSAGISKVHEVACFMWARIAAAPTSAEAAFDAREALATDLGDLLRHPHFDAVAAAATAADGDTFGADGLGATRLSAQLALDTPPEGYAFWRAVEAP
jgi:hypothetical protein